MKNWGLYIALMACLAACDSSKNIEPPAGHFFVKFYGNEGNQEGVDAVVNADGTITLLGNTDSFDMGKQLYLVNVQPDGQVVWEQTLGGQFNDFAKDIELTTDGRLVIIADSEKNPGDMDIFIATLTPDGNLIDSNLTGFTSPSTSAPTDEKAVSVTQTTDGFVVAGSTSNLSLKPSITGGNDSRDALHLRYFDDLTLYPNTWRQAHGPGDFDEGTKIVQVSPNDFYFFGYSNTQTGDFNFYVLGLGKDGETNQTDNFLPGKTGSDEILTSVLASPVQSGEGFLLTGVSTNTTGAKDIFAVKLRKTLSFTATDIQYQTDLQASLGNIADERTATYSSVSSGFLVVSNFENNGVQNLYLTRLSNSGSVVWNMPFNFGGSFNNSIGSVIELPDGSIGVIGTVATGQSGETKMALIKTNKDGKFLE